MESNLSQALSGVALSMGLGGSSFGIASFPQQQAARLSVAEQMKRQQQAQMPFRGQQINRPRKKVECEVVEPESTIPHSTHLLYGGG